MFVLSVMKQVVRIPPELFNLSRQKAVTGVINKKLANKVILNVGLCIAMLDINKIGEAYVIPGDGGIHTMVEFRYIVFQPFIEEILVGKIRSCSPEGVHVSLGFFNDIIIPPSALQHPSKFNETELAWVWEYDDSGDGCKHDLFMDPGENVRFRVTAEQFTETSPSGNRTYENADNRIPYSITGTINEPGLGLLSWWDNN